MTSVFEGLIKFRAALKHPKKSGKNPHLGSKYVTLDDLIEAVDVACVASGLGWLQSIDQAERGVSATTTIFSAAGHIEIPGPVVPVSKADAQGLGSAVTYARRYALAVAFGVASDEDDDGHAAAKAPPENSGPQEPLRSPAAAGASDLSEAQIKRLYAIAKANGIKGKDDLRVFLAGLEGFPTAEHQLTRTQYDELCDVRLPALGGAR